MLSRTFLANPILIKETFSLFSVFEILWELFLLVSHDFTIVLLNFAHVIDAEPQLPLPALR